VHSTAPDILRLKMGPCGSSNSSSRVSEDSHATLDAEAGLQESTAGSCLLPTSRTQRYLAAAMWPRSSSNGSSSSEGSGDLHLVRVFKSRHNVKSPAGHRKMHPRNAFTMCSLLQSCYWDTTCLHSRCALQCRRHSDISVPVLFATLCQLLN
jgi:hypothetical protein